MKLTLNGRLVEERAITVRLLNKIVYSKRLLFDHLEVLVQCMSKIDSTLLEDLDKSVETVCRNIFTVRNACIVVGATILEICIKPRNLPLMLKPSILAIGSFGAFYAVKQVLAIRNKFVEMELENLIRAINEFGNCIRRNITYFNEITFIKNQKTEDWHQIERAWDCITAIKEVTEILYEVTRKLDSQYPIPRELCEYYATMEDIKECKYFKNNVTDYLPEHIKDFHNIFAYVQSQFLLRLALTVLSEPSLSQLKTELVKINCLIRQMVIQEEKHFKNLIIELNKKKSLEVDALNENRVTKTRNNPMDVLQSSSLKLSACMVAVAGECQALDIALQRLTDTEQLVAVAHNMRSIENALSVCFDDFQRLMLVYNRFLNSKLETQRVESKSKSDAADDEFPESFLRVEISQNPNDMEKKDDFYAYMFDEKLVKAEKEQLEKEEREKHNEDLEILNFERRITKGKFQPVLKQLKDRINPIREVMLAKEREVLAAKGINVDELFSKDDEEHSDEEHMKYNNAVAHKEDNNDSDGSEGSDDIEFEKRSRKLKDRDNFAEMRNFLAQKQNINLFKLDAQSPTFNTLVDEDILESEC